MQRTLWRNFLQKRIIILIKYRWMYICVACPRDFLGPQAADRAHTPPMCGRAGLTTLRHRKLSLDNGYAIHG